MLISADVSYFQKKVDNSYPRQWLVFRCCDGGFLDPNATFNANWSRGAVVQGRMRGWATYVVYRPGQNAAILANLTKIVPLDRVMIDVESWGGQIRGDHSDDVNQLLDDLAAIVGQGKVWLYGNLGNLNEICPRRRPWAQLVIASWGPNKPNVPNMVGWQYTDGAHQAGGRPLSSAPFGNCDHNELYVDELSPSGGGTPIGVDDVGQVDTITPAALQQMQDAVWNKKVLDGIASDVLARIDGNAKAASMAGPASDAAALAAIQNQLTSLQAAVSELANQHAGATGPINITLTGTGTPS